MFARAINLDRTMEHEYKIRAVVFGSLKAGTLDIHIGYNYGMNDGGGLRRISRELVPENCRFPNTHLWVTLKKGEITLIEKMDPEEIEGNQV